MVAGRCKVDVWLVDPETVSDAALLRRYDELLPPQERDKCARFRFQRHRHQCRVTRALVRDVLSRYVDLPPDAWRFQTNRYGRPEIAGERGSGLRFNLSHTDGLIACAVVWHRDIGVDVENLLRVGETVSIADMFFAPSEVAALRALPREHQRECFFHYWTLKESYIKARGMGLAIPLEQFAFDLSDPSALTIGFDSKLPDDPAAWRFALSRPTPQHVLALALRSKEEEIDVETRWITPLSAPT